jgi:hypothetical protein
MANDSRPTADRGSILRLCLCADDFGISAAVSHGILEALAAGRLSAVSALTTQPDWRASALLLQGYTARADIGLHLNLTLAAPLTAMPAFAPDGCFPKVAGIMRLARQERPLPPQIVDEIEQEIGAQIDAFCEALGRFPDFLDGHQHVHVLPGVRQIVFDVLESKGLRGKIWLRNSGDRPARILSRKIEIGKAMALSWLGRGFAAAARARGFSVNDGFAGFSDFSETRNYAADFSRYLVAPGAAHLIMCHPGHVDDTLVRLDPVTRSREKELAFLLSPEFSECLARHGAELMAMRYIFYN